MSEGTKKMRLLYCIFLCTLKASNNPLSFFIDGEFCINSFKRGCKPRFLAKCMSEIRDCILFTFEIDGVPAQACDVSKSLLCISKKSALECIKNDPYLSYKIFSSFISTSKSCNSMLYDALEMCSSHSMEIPGDLQVLFTTKSVNGKNALSICLKQL